MNSLKITKSEQAALAVPEDLRQFESALSSPSTLTAAVLDTARAENRRHVLGYFAEVSRQLNFSPSSTGTDIPTSRSGVLSSDVVRKLTSSSSLQRRLVTGAPDSLALARARAGAPTREHCIERLLGLVSLKRGLELLSDASEASGGERIRTLRQVSATAPWMTTYDVLVLSLLEKPPRMLAKSFHLPGSSVPLANLHRIDQAGVWYSQIETQKREELADSTESHFGVNKPSENFEHVRFTHDARGLMFAATMSGVQDAEIWRRLFLLDPSTETLLAGYGKLLEAALCPEVVGGLSPRAKRDLAKFLELKRTNKPGQTLAERMREDGIGEGGLNAHGAELLRAAYGSIEVVDLSSANLRPLSGQDLARMAGLLAQLPASLVPGTPAELYFRPLGKGLQFFNGSGGSLEYVPLSAFQQFDAEVELREAYTADRADNETIIGTVRELSRGIRKLVDARGNDVTELERSARQFEREFRLALPIYPIPYESDSFDESRSGASEVNRLSFVETAAILQASRRLPSALMRLLLTDVMQVQKEITSRFSAEELASGGYVGGSFEMGIITLRQRSALLMDPDLAFSRAVSVWYHELGHNLWRVLKVSERRGWAALFEESVRRREALADEFVSSYARTSPVEDFCETLAAVLTRGGDFYAGHAAHSLAGRKAAFVVGLLERRVDGFELGEIPGDRCASACGPVGRPFEVPLPQDHELAELESRILISRVEAGKRARIAEATVRLGVGAESEERLEALLHGDDPRFERLTREAPPMEDEPFGEECVDHDLVSLVRLRRTLRASKLRAATAALNALAAGGDVQISLIVEDDRLQAMTVEGSGPCSYQSDLLLGRVLRPLLENWAEAGRLSCSLKKGERVSEPTA